MKKVCTKCGIEKELEEFCKDKRRPLGFGSYCKECVKEYKKEYREQNKDKIKEYQKEYMKEYMKEYREQNKDKIKEYMKEYQERNKDKIKEYQKQNKDKIKEYMKEYQERNKKKLKEYRGKYRQSERGKMVCKINCHKRRAKAKENGGSFTPEEWQEAMQFFDNKCAWSGKTLTSKNESVDHIYPNSKGGTLNINNVVPCDRSINSSKNDSDWEEWYPKQPFYSKEREKKIREWIELKTAISLFD